MLKNIQELKQYPFVLDISTGKVSKLKIKLFIENLGAFLHDESFRTKFGFKKEEYTTKEYFGIIREIIERKDSSGDGVIEYDLDVHVELLSQRHPYEKYINSALRKIGEIIRDEHFSRICPLLILVKKENLRSWDEERETIKIKINGYFREINNEDILNFASGIYRVKTEQQLLGISVDDDRNKSIHAIVSVPDKGTIIHETEHFIHKLFNELPGGEIGGLAGFFGGQPKLFSFFNAEFLPYLLQYDNLKVYKYHLSSSKKHYAFSFPGYLDDEYLLRLNEFANLVRTFIKKYVAGLLCLIALYPTYRYTYEFENKNKDKFYTQVSDSWVGFELPKNPSDDIERFKIFLARRGYDNKDGIIENSWLWEFIQKRFQYHAG